MYTVKVFKRRVGITGLRACGKTTFLTSLINHLQYHSPDIEHNFQLAAENHVKIKKFKELEVRKGQNRFPYTNYRNELIQKSQWPIKTTDCSYYRCTFQRSDFKSILGFLGPLDIELEFFDFPGDRLADIGIAEAPNYRLWSAEILQKFENENGYKEHASDFLHAVSQDNINESQVIRAYKVLLARLLKYHFRALITPSTFIVDRNGSDELSYELLEKASSLSEIEHIVEHRIVGINKESQFTPLPSNVSSRSKQNKRLVKLFAKRYSQYRKDVVLPIVKYLRHCHRLIILVDIAEVLTNGPGMYNDTQAIIEQACNTLDPGKNKVEQYISAGLKRLSGDPIIKGGVLSWKPKGISRLAFVASKIDKVHRKDRKHLLTLLEEMTRKPTNDIEGATIKHFTCSAIVSSRSDDSDIIPGEDGKEYRRLIGFPLKDAHGNPLPTPPIGSSRDDHLRKLERVSIVPPQWPRDNWKKGDFQFFDLYPFISERKDVPPKQINLDTIFNFIMDETLFE